MHDEELLCVVNAGNISKDFEWIKEKIGQRTSVSNESDRYALIALQGPLSVEILKSHTESDISAIPVFGFIKGKVSGAEAIISRTGYTGEDGFELYIENSVAPKIWNDVLADGRAIPAGLGARDTLRLEAALPLYGHELNEEITPLEAGLSRFVKLNKDNFIGKEALLQNLSERLLIGIELTEKGIPREGYRVFRNGVDIGFVTSGTHSPTLKQGIAMAMLTKDIEPGVEVALGIRGKLVAGKTIKLPFYKRQKRA
jgi:aminomethyltransferase